MFVPEQTQTKLVTRLLDYLLGVTLKFRALECQGQSKALEQKTITDDMDIKETKKSHDRDEILEKAELAKFFRACTIYLK